MKKFLILIGFLAYQSIFTMCFAASNSDDYKLLQVVAYSRHNLRTPLNIGKDSILSKITPHAWYNWTGDKGNLTVRGGELEVIMGAYFKDWLEHEKLIPKNYIPKEGEVRFYANSVQRTIATARFFASGIFPIANIDVENKFRLDDPDRFDVVFAYNYPLRKFPQTSSFKERVNSEIKAIDAKKLGKNAVSNVRLVENVLDFKNSAYAKENNTLLTDDKDYFTVKVDDSLEFGGSIRPAMKIADALILEYYETDKNNMNVFGKDLSLEEWRKIGDLQSIGLYSIFHLHTASRFATKPMLETIKSELKTPSRKFTFLCGHDIGVAGVISALNVDDYTLPESVEPLTPIGVKLVIEKRLGKDNKEYAALKLVYQSVNQMRNREQLSSENPPVTVDLNLRGLTKNKDGLYLFDDVIKRLDEAIKN